MSDTARGSLWSIRAVIVIHALLATLACSTTRASVSPPTPAVTGSLHAMSRALPLHFEANHGQLNGDIKFLARMGARTVYLTSTDAVVVSKHAPTAAHVLRMKYVGANAEPRVTATEELSTAVNYFVGNDPVRWRANVPTYAKVRYTGVYPGIDVVYYGNDRRLEYDVIIHPGADPATVTLQFEGAERLEIDAHGDLLLHTPAGPARQHKPFIYQDIDGTRREIAGGYVLKGADRVGFVLAGYDATRPLVIDPLLVYSTFLGGMTEDRGQAIAVDAASNVYIAGSTSSLDFPTTPGSVQPTTTGMDAFVAKFDAAGALVYATYLGGGAAEFASGIAVDPAGNAYVSGETQSLDFPATAGAAQSIYGGGDNDAFVVKLNPSGSALIYSTYLGGTLGDFAAGIALDAAGSAYVIGTTISVDFPVTAGAFQAGGTGVRAFVTKLHPAGSSLMYSTVLGGDSNTTGMGIAVDAAGQAHITGVTHASDFPTTPGALQTTFHGGEHVFVTKFDAVGATLSYSTYLGLSGAQSGTAIALDAAGDAYVTGFTSSPDFPITAGAVQSQHGGNLDAFVIKLDFTGSTLLYSTLLGGGADDFGTGIAVDAAGNAYVTGVTGAIGFPTTLGALPSSCHNGSTFETFVAALNPTATGFVYSTCFGGSETDQGWGIAIDGLSPPNAYVIGYSHSSDLPVTSGAFQPMNGGTFDAFMVKIGRFNTPIGSDVNVGAGENVTVSFPVVLGPGDTGAATSSSGEAPPAGFSLNDPPTYYEIQTTATYTGPVRVCIAYSPAQFEDSATLRLFHFDNSVWVDVTTSNDTVTGLLCGETATLSPFIVAQRTPLDVAIDIKPGSTPNTINLGSSGAVPVAILSTATFDARTVDPLTVTLASAPVKLTGKGQPLTSVRDVDGDGRLDMIVHIETNALQVSADDTSAVLKGRTSSGQPIRGTDSVRVVP